MVDKMNGLILLVIGIIALMFILGVFLTLIYLKKRKDGSFKEPDYQAFFVMGLCFLPLGIIFTFTINLGFIGFMGLGIFYIALGLANKDKWERRN
jgi:hypothetical protein